MKTAPLLQLSAAEVRRALPMREAIAAMREAFAQLSRGEVTLPTRLRLDAPQEHGAALVMPCHSRAMKLFSLKLATVYPDNPRRGLPMIQSVVILTDGATGSPLAMMEGSSLTDIRTGAASGLATDLLAHPDADTLAVIGTGVQACTQLAAVCAVRGIRQARVYGRNARAAEEFATRMGRESGIPVTSVSSPEEAVRDAQIICTATSSSAPVLPTMR